MHRRAAKPEVSLKIEFGPGAILFGTGTFLYCQGTVWLDAYAKPAKADPEQASEMDSAPGEKIA